MTKHWTFGQKVALGFAGTVLLALMIGVVAVYALRRVVETKDQVIDVNAHFLLDSQIMLTRLERKVAESRGYMLTGDERFLSQMRETRRQFAQTLARLKPAAHTTESARLLDAIERAESEHQATLEGWIKLRQSGASPDAITRAYEEVVRPKRDQLEAYVTTFVERERRLLEEAKAASSLAAGESIQWVMGIAVAVCLLGAFIALSLTRALGVQIGSAVGFVQSSSVQLEASANQQATGVKEQATAMNEITTTINELLTTSRQIAASAQRVAQIAAQTATSASGGDSIVVQAHSSMSAIQRQVDLIVGHMVELGKKSQQIGGVLDIVSELAEQTNILAINASIEAAGAGESGRRFGVVADEIRKLADRVTNATKEIRALIEDVRTAVNTTVMATETGSKAVDAGSKHFNEVATSFKQIAGMVGTTTEAAREIELSTKQQATAVEQVNLAISNVAQATRENQASSTQTLQTVSELAKVSRDLSRLIQTQATA